jgi:hypothetical protein
MRTAACRRMNNQSALRNEVRLNNSRAKRGEVHRTHHQTVIAQTYLTDRWIILCDGSTDRTVEIVEGCILIWDGDAKHHVFAHKNSTS